MKGLDSSISFRALGFAPVWFLAAMASPPTARLALPLLAIVAAWSAWRDRLDLASRLDAIEWGIFVFAMAWIACALTGIDPDRSLRLSIPMLAALVADRDRLGEKPSVGAIFAAQRKGVLPLFPRREAMGDLGDDPVDVVRRV